MSKDSAGSTLFDDLKDVFGKFGLVASIVAILTTSVQAFAMQAAQPYLDVYQVVMLNVPMVASATILAMMAMRLPRAYAGFGPTFLAVIAAIVAPYTVAWLFDLAPGVNGYLNPIVYGCPSWQPDCEVLVEQRDAFDLLRFLSPGAAISLASDILMHYFTEDRAMNTLSAAVAGIFIAWVFEYKLLPRTRAA